jgi:hypothetical protein
MILNEISVRCFAECPLCWVAHRLSITHAEYHLCSVLLMLSITYAQYHLCWTSLMLSVTYKSFMLLSLCWVLLCLVSLCWVSLCWVSWCPSDTAPWLSVIITLSKATAYLSGVPYGPPLLVSSTCLAHKYLTCVAVVWKCQTLWPITLWS